MLSNKHNMEYVLTLYGEYSYADMAHNYANAKKAGATSKTQDPQMKTAPQNT